MAMSMQKPADAEAARLLMEQIQNDFMSGFTHERPRTWPEFYAQTEELLQRLVIYFKPRRGSQAVAQSDGQCDGAHAAPEQAGIKAEIGIGGVHGGEVSRQDVEAGVALAVAGQAESGSPQGLQGNDIVRVAVKHLNDVLPRFEAYLASIDFNALTQRRREGQTPGKHADLAEIGGIVVHEPSPDDAASIAESRPEASDGRR